jgi:hypothetical protein
MMMMKEPMMMTRLIMMSTLGDVVIRLDYQHHNP